MNNKSKNRFGLPRHIPEDVKRQVRQECGFGCVLCGEAIVEYDHVDPEFKDALDHDPMKMALLCPTCHEKKSKGRISVREIAEARLSPYSIKRGHSRTASQALRLPYEVQVGSNRFLNVRSIVRRGIEEWFKIEPPVQPEGPIQLSAVFYDFTTHESSTQPQLEICRNEWILKSGAWDIQIEGQDLKILRGPRDVVMKLIMIPPSIIVIEKLYMMFGSTGLEVADGCVTLHCNGVTLSFADNYVCFQDGATNAAINLP